MPTWTRFFCSSSWKPAQAPVRSAALALAAKSPCHPPWSPSASCPSADGGTQLQACPVLFQRSFLSGCRRGWVPDFCSCLALLLCWLSCLRPGSCSGLCIKAQAEPSAWVTFLSAGRTDLKPEPTFGVMPWLPLAEGLGLAAQSLYFVTPGAVLTRCYPSRNLQLMAPGSHGQAPPCLLLEVSQPHLISPVWLKSDISCCRRWAGLWPEHRDVSKAVWHSGSHWFSAGFVLFWDFWQCPIGLYGLLIFLMSWPVVRHT